MTLSRYLTYRCRVSIGHLLSAFGSAIAAAWVGALSVLMTVGCSQSLHPLSALPRKRLAALVLRAGERQKSTVFPCLSTAL